MISWIRRIISGFRKRNEATAAPKKHYPDTLFDYYSLFKFHLSKHKKLKKNGEWVRYRPFDCLKHARECFEKAKLHGQLPSQSNQS